MVLVHQFELYLQPTYKPLKCPNVVIGTDISTVIVG